MNLDHISTDIPPPSITGVSYQMWNKVKNHFQEMHPFQIGELSISGQYHALVYDQYKQVIELRWIRPVKNLEEDTERKKEFTIQFRSAMQISYPT